MKKKLKLFLVVAMIGGAVSAYAFGRNCVCLYTEDEVTCCCGVVGVDYAYEQWSVQ